MNEYQEVVDELRFVLQREVIERSDELINLIETYSQYCHDVNARLRRCDECVKQGLRSEALHLAEAKPNLLDAVAVLDFAEREELIEVVNLYFLTAPEPLLLDVAAALNRAYAEHEPLLKMLDLHRLLALGRSPLGQRLTVLRSLAELDVASPHWESDVREMERARFRELDAESAAAAKSGNTSVLKSIVVEIQTPGWREAIPAALVREVKSRANVTVRGNARQRIAELNEELYSAFSALDASKARPLREEWKQNRQLSHINDSDPLIEHVSPVFDWLDDEDRKAVDSKAFSKCVADIERAIEDESISAEDLKRLKLTADRFERSLPTMLETRFRSRLGTLELNERRRKTLFIGSIASVFAVVIAVFGFVVYASIEGDKTRRLVAAATEMIDDGKLSEAQKLVDQHAAQATSEAWLSIKKKLADAEQFERDRVANWKTQIATARDNADLGLVEVALKQARELSRTAEEKIELGQLESTWQKRANEAMAEREKVFREAITEASAALKKLDASLATSDAFDLKRIRPLQDAVEKQLTILEPGRNAVSKELVSQASVLESRFKASQQTVADLTKKAELLERLTEAVLMLPENSRSIVQPERYEAIVTEIIAALPRDPQVVAMQAAIEFNPFPATQAYQKLIKRWGHLKPADKNDVETRLKELHAFITEHPQSPDRELLGQYESWLASILRRYEEGGDPDEGVQRRFVALFSSKFVKEGQVLQDKEGNTYYLKSESKSVRTYDNGKLIDIEYVVGFNGESKPVTKMKTENLVTTKPSLAPHQEIASKARSMFRNVAVDHWRESIQELVETLLKADKVDPFLRYLLVLKTVEFGGRGDQFLEQELSPLLEKLNDEEIDRSVPWMDPKNDSAAAARARALVVLEKIPVDSVGPLFIAANKRQAQFEQALFSPRFAVGWLEKNSHGDWNCRTKWTPEGEYNLQVVSRPDASGIRKWSPVGNAKRNSWLIDPDEAQNVGEATVVFASLISSEPKTARSP